MPDPEQLKILKQDVQAWNDWRKENPNIKPNLIKTDLRGANLSGADLIEANFSDAYLLRSNFSNADLSGADLSRANLYGANLSGADLIEAKLSGANLSGANLRDAVLSGTDLSGANLIGAYLSGANLSEADFGEANLSRADLIKAKLSGANLGGANLRNAVLSGTDLSGANLRGAYLSRAVLSRANLIGVNLSEADLSEADLGEADLSETNLSGANFYGADLNRTDFTRAKFNITIITSRTCLSILKFPLTDEQKAAIIFSDEKAEVESKRKVKRLRNYPYLTIEFKDEISWKNEWLAFLLLAIQITYNNCFYLSNTEDKDIKIIKAKIEKKCQVSAINDIELKIIQQHSPLIIQYVQYAIEHAPQVVAVLSSLAALILVISKSYKNFMEGKKAKKEGLKIDEEKRKIQIEIKEKEFALTSQKAFTHKELMENIQEELEHVTISTSNNLILENKTMLLFLASKNLQIVLGALNDTANIGNILVKMEEPDNK